MTHTCEADVRERNVTECARSGAPHRIAELTEQVRGSVCLWQSLIDVAGEFVTGNQGLERVDVPVPKRDNLRDKLKIPGHGWGYRPVEGRGRRQVQGWFAEGSVS